MQTNRKRGGKNEEKNGEKEGRKEGRKEKINMALSRGQKIVALRCVDLEENNPYR